MEFKDVEELNQELLRRVADERDDADGIDADKIAFTRVMIDWMTADGGWNGGTAFEFAARGMRASGYAWDGSDPGTLDVFVSVFNPKSPSQTMSASEINRQLDRGAAFVREVLEGRRGVARFESGPAADLSTLLDSGRREWETIRIVLVANARILSNVRAGGFTREEEHIGDIHLEFHVWDLDRMFRLLQGGRGHEPVTVDFIDAFEKPVLCLEIPQVTEEYSSCLAVFPGDVLADLYEHFGTQLLEKNVRVFLQERGKVNKGILDTIRLQPQMFLAYNNGISITARDISFGRDAEGQRTLRRLVDFQIVNGGQTTASLHNARKKHHLDLAKTFVQAKISVVGERADEEALVREISLYANSQNKIKKSDLGADGVFHRVLEKLSRETWTPDGKTKWFYERAAGQYEVAKQLEGKKTGGSQRFARENPKSQRMQKTDVAKYILAWQGSPEVVSLGGEKCFQKFSSWLREGFIPDETFFKMLVAKAILFKNIDAIVRRQGDTSYKANIVAYTMALLNIKTDSRLNLENIWRRQGISKELEAVLDDMVRKVRAVILDSAAGNNVTEWGKKTECWEAVQDIKMNTEVLLRKVGGVLPYPAPKDGNNIVISEGETAEEREQRERVGALKSEKWLAIAQWGHDTGNLNDWQVRFSGSIGTQLVRGKRLSPKQVNCCCKILDEVERFGVDPEGL